MIDANVFDTTITLQTQTYQQDFGQNGNAKVPAVPCTMDANCAAISQLSANTAGRCDTAAKQCYADASVTLHSEPIILSKDSAFQSGVGQKAVQSVRSVVLAYTIPTNTLTFNVPSVTLYVGPQGSTSVTDAGVALVGTIPSVAASKVVTTPGTLTVSDGSPARQLLVNAVTTPNTPLVFLVAATPRINAGEQVPGGNIQINVTPSLVVGLPR